MQRGPSSYAHHVHNTIEEVAYQFCACSNATGMSTAYAVNVDGMLRLQHQAVHRLFPGPLRSVVTHSPAGLSPQHRGAC